MYQEQCPISTESTIALKSDCSYSSNQFCPARPTASKICMNNVDVPVTDYCDFSGQGHNYWQCPKGYSGLNFDQCYDKYMIIVHFLKFYPEIIL